MSGKQARISSTNYAAEVQNLEMSPVSMSFNEVHETLQWGIVDCAVSSVYAAALFGLDPVAPYFHYNNAGDPLRYQRLRLTQLPKASGRRAVKAPFVIECPERKSMRRERRIERRSSGQRNSRETL